MGFFHPWHQFAVRVTDVTVERLPIGLYWAAHGSTNHLQLARHRPAAPLRDGRSGFRRGPSMKIEAEALGFGFEPQRRVAPVRPSSACRL